MSLCYVVQLFIFVYILFRCTYVRVCWYLFLCVALLSVSVCMFLKVFVCVHASMCACAHVHACVPECEGGSVYTFMSEYIFVHVSTHVCLYLCANVCLSVCVCTCA